MSGERIKLNFAPAIPEVKQTIIFKSFVTNGETCGEKMMVQFFFAFFPKATNQTGMAGLLTYSLFTAFPSRTRGTVAKNGKQTKRAYSSGNCSGFPPDSLFIQKTHVGSGTNTGVKGKVIVVCT